MNLIGILILLCYQGRNLESIAERIKDVKDKAVDLCGLHKIAVCDVVYKKTVFRRSSQDESNKIFHIDKPNPATPMQTAKEITYWKEIWLPDILKKLTEYPGYKTKKETTGLHMLLRRLDFHSNQLQMTNTKRCFQSG